MRGRLINRFKVRFGVLDVEEMDYDSDYLAPSVAGVPRKEREVELPAQIEDGTWFRSVFKPQGLEQDGEISVILHYSDLEGAGLVDSNGASAVGVGSRLVSISQESGVVVRQYPDPPGMYVTQARDSSFGLAMDHNPHRNLCFLLLSPRPRSV